MWLNPFASSKANDGDPSVVALSAGANRVSAVDQPTGVASEPPPFTRNSQGPHLRVSPPLPRYTMDQLPDSSLAEDTVLANVEARTRRGEQRPSSDRVSFTGWQGRHDDAATLESQLYQVYVGPKTAKRPSMKPQRATTWNAPGASAAQRPPVSPLAAVSHPFDAGDSFKGTKLKSMAKQVIHNNRIQKMLAHTAWTPMTSNAQVLLESMHEDYTYGGGARPAAQRTNIFGDPLSSTLQQPQHLVTSANDQASNRHDETMSATIAPMSEELPLLSHEATDSSRRLLRKRRRQRTCWEWITLCCCAPLAFYRIFRHILFEIISLWVALACCGSAYILFYYFNDPNPDFLPGHWSAAFWLNFIGRQLLVLELARFTQFLVIDCFTLEFKVALQSLGPFLTFLTIQSKGWPFLVTAWGTWDLFLLHGDNKFQTHWLYWTGIEFYAIKKNDATVLSSRIYLRVLLSLIVAGVFTSIKRTFVALSFGQRTMGK
jgi:hypothetical protein